MTDDLTPQPGVAVVGGRPPAGRPAVSPAKAGEADAAEPSAEPDTGPDTGPRDSAVAYRRPRAGAGRAPRWAVPALAVVTIVSVVLAVVFGVLWSGLNSQRDTTATVKRVAYDFLVALTNFRPSTLDGDLANLQTYATGDFAKQANQFFGTSIRQALEQVQASSDGQIRYLFVQSLKGSQANVYAWVDQTFTNNKLTSLQTDTLQMSLSMTDTSSGWKISNVSVLNSPSPNAIP